VLSHLFTTMAIEHSEEATKRIISHLVHMAVRVLHVRPVSTVLVFGVCVLLNTCRIYHVPSDVLGTAGTAAHAEHSTHRCCLWYTDSCRSATAAKYILLLLLLWWFSTAIISKSTGAIVRLLWLFLSSTKTWIASTLIIVWRAVE